MTPTPKDTPSTAELIADGWRERAEDAEATVARAAPLIEAAREYARCVDQNYGWAAAGVLVKDAARAFAKSEGEG